MDVQLVLGTQRLDDLKEMMSDTAGDKNVICDTRYLG